MYTNLVLGGTFDHLHAGHRKLLSMAFSLSHHVMLGLTASNMNENKILKETILPYERRKKDIEAYARSIGRKNDLEILPIHDLYGTTLEDTTLQAIVVTYHTVKGAELINDARKKQKMSELTVHICDFFYDDVGQILSSTRIREGKVNRDGYVYTNLFTKTMTISPTLREILREPLGKTYDTFLSLNKSSSQKCIFVGDVVTKTAIEKNLSFASAWIDGRSQRKPYTFTISHQYKTVDTNHANLAGTIHTDISAFMHDHLVSGDTVYTIHGEEDLLALPAILFTPLGYAVMYGNPHDQKGITIVEVTEEKKERIRNLLTKNQ